MAYRNKTYVIFDGDNDMWAYGYMLGWCKNDHVAFDFYNAHEFKKLNATSSEQHVKRVLKERLGTTKQAIVLIGESTKNLYRYVRWEIENCLDASIPIVAVNLNGKRQLDVEFCPPLLREAGAVHVSFNAKIIKHALDNFCDNYVQYKSGSDWHYNNNAYKSLGL